MQPSPAHDPRTLALACSTLARAGQTLSTASAPAQARGALQQVADQIGSDRNLATVMATDEVVRKCREAAAAPDDASTITACRQIATQLARRASTLAAGIQKAAAAPTPQPVAPPAPAPSPAPAQPIPTTSPAPQPEPLPAAAQILPTPQIPAPIPQPRSAPTPITPPPAAKPARPVPTPAPAAPAAPRVDPALVARISVAQTGPERQAAIAALQAGRRFALVGNATLIDTQANRIWTAQLAPGASHPDATRFAASSNAGGKTGWRLPSSDELLALLSNNGLQALRAAGVLPANHPILLWSSTIRSRFFGFFKDAAAAHSGTGELTHQSLKNPAVQSLLTRD